MLVETRRPPLPREDAEGASALHPRQRPHRRSRDDYTDLHRRHGHPDRRYKAELYHSALVSVLGVIYFGLVFLVKSSRSKLC